MNKEIEIPEGYEAKIVGNKVVLEPKESEDEKIRKAILGLTYLDGIEPILTKCSITARDIRTYLEKQKEQKPEVKYVYPKFRVGEEIVEVTPNGYCPSVVVKYIGEGVYSCESKDGKRFLSFPIKNENKYRLVEQKPVEWSEEDKEMIERLIRHTQKEFNELCNDRYGHQEIISDLKESCRERMNWLENRLKSLRPQPHTVSIKDATKFGNLEYERGVKDGIQSEKDRRWKPSEEQMDDLSAVEAILRGYGYDTMAGRIKSFSEDIKKQII